MNLIQNDEESNSDLAKWPWSGKYHAGCPTVVTYIGLSPYLHVRCPKNNIKN